MNERKEESIEEEYYGDEFDDENSIPERSEAMLESSINVGKLDPKKDLTKKENVPAAES